MFDHVNNSLFADTFACLELGLKISCIIDFLNVKVYTKIGPHGPELIWHFGTKLAKNSLLSLCGQYIKAHEV